MASPAAVLSILVQARGIAQTQAQLKRLNASADDTAKHTDQMASKFRGLNGTLGDFNRAMTSSRNAVTLVKWPAMIAGAGAATQAVNALAAGAVGLGAAMAPLAGLGAATGVAYTAMGQAMGVAKLATMGMEDAINGQKGAMEKLSPVQQDMVKQIRALKDESQGLRGAAQRGLLPGAAEGLAKIVPLFDALRPVVGATARVMGDLAARAGALVASWKGDLLTVGRANVKIIGNIGTAALSAANAARNLIAAAAPLAVWLSRLVADGAKWVSVQISAARESGALAGFFQRTAAVVGRLIQIAQNLGAAFLNIGKAAFPLGDKLLTDFTLLTAKFRAWTDSAKGKNTIAEFFARAQPPLYAMFRLIGDIGKAFFALGEGGAGSLAPLIDQIRTQLLPALTGILQAGSAGGANFLSALIKTASDLLLAFTPLLGPSGPLTLFVQLVGVAARAVTALTQTVPGAATAMSVFAGAMSVASTVGLARFISQTLGARAGLGVLTPAIQFFTKEVVTATGATGRTQAQLALMRIQLIATAAAQQVVAVATRVWAATQAALNVVMRANPFVLVATLLVALGAALVLAYQRSETFRNIVNGAFNAVKSVAQSVFGFLRTFIPGVWAAIRSATTTAWNGIRTVVTTVLTGIRTLITTYFTAYRTIITTAWNAIRTVTTTVWNGIRTATVAVWTALRTTASSVWAGIRDAILNPIRAARETLNGIWSGIKGAASAAWEALKKGASDFAGAFKKIIVDAFGNAVQTIAKFAIAILDVIDKIPGVDMKGAKEAVGKAAGVKVDGKARGGAFARTGGMVNAPITLMGEEAPRYPEFVIPTNPAYRKRARGLLGQAAGAIGFQAGGVWSKAQLAALWARVNPGLGDPNLMAAIALAESGGRQGIVNSIGATGLWQIHPGGPQYLDPVANARTAGMKLRTQGLGAWEAYTNGSYRRFLRGGGGIIGALKGVAGAVGDVIAGGLDALLGKLPGVGDLPDWLKGTGKYVLGKATAWIKDKIGALTDLGGGGGKDLPAGAPGNLKAAMAMARQMGLAITSTTGGQHVRGSYHYQGRAFDTAGSPAQMAAFFRAVADRYGRNITELFYDPLGGIKNGQRIGAIGGHSDHVHVAFRKGGQYGPYMGAYKNGGILPNDGLYYGHRGETVIPFATGGTPWTRGYLDIKAINKNAVWDPRTRQYVQKPMPTAWDMLSPEQKFIPATMGEPSEVADSNSDLIDAINAEIEEQRKTQEAIQAHTDALNAVQAEVKRSNDIANAIQKTTGFQWQKAFADAMTGQIVGWGVMPRKATPGTGVEFRY